MMSSSTVTVVSKTPPRFPLALPVALAMAVLPAAGSFAASGSTRTEPVPTWGLSFGFGPYQPDMGASHTYYQRIYASEKDSSLFSHRPLMTTIEADWYLLRDFGLLGPMLHFGYWKVGAPTRVCNDSAGNPGACSPEQVVAGVSAAGTDHTSMTVFPVGIGLVYKLDLLKRYTPVPLVPFVKGGLDYYLWRNTLGSRVSHHAGHPGEGGTWGAQATAGIALNLDFLEPDTASRGHASVGLADSYLFGQVSWLAINGFGDKKRLDFSDTLIQVGLALDFD